MQQPQGFLDIAADCSAVISIYLADFLVGVVFIKAQVKHIPPLFRQPGQGCGRLGIVQHNHLTADKDGVLRAFLRLG